MLTSYAIPTRYKGIQYRSRLEARWAAFFDLAGWHVEYEPVDFNGWIPDFAIIESSLVYVEIKPTHVFPVEVAQKIDRSGCEEDVLILGNILFPICEDPGSFYPGFGWLGEWIDEPKYRCWSAAQGGMWRQSTPRQSVDRLGFCHAYQSFHDRITGLDSSCREQNGLWLLQHYWKTAGNQVQWYPRRVL